MSDESTTAKNQRNPVERMIVWGGIVILLGVVAVEATARMGYTMTLKRFQGAIERVEAGEGDAVSLAQAQALVVGFPSVTEDEAAEQISFRWSGLLKEYGGIHLVYTGDAKEIIGLTTDAPPEQEPGPEIDNELVLDEPEESEPGGNGGPGGGSGAGEGGPRGFDPMQFDTDGDGQISRDEAPERMAERFDEIDANADGFADADELAASRPQRGPGGPGGGGGGRRGFDPMQFDADGDGKVSREEAPEQMAEFFDRIDTNGDGFMDEEEFAARRAARGGGRGGDGGGEDRPERPQRPE